MNGAVQRCELSATAREPDPGGPHPGKGAVHLRAAALGLCVLLACGGTVEEGASEPGGVAADWMDAVAEAVRREKLSPPQASRAFAYVALALDAGAAGRSTLPGWVTSLGDRPEIPAPPAGALDRPTCASVAARAIAGSIFKLPESLQAFGQQAEQQRSARIQEGLPIEALERSEAWGLMIAGAFQHWMERDGYAETRDDQYRPAGEPGSWEPTPPAFSAAVEPSWGSLRPFALPSREHCALPEPPPYSERPVSAFYVQAKAVRDAVNGAGPHQRDLVNFWADGAGATATPAGHWVAIIGQQVRERELSLERAAGIYAATTVAMADAFIVCWRSKFKAAVLRPVTYIQAYIQPGWLPLIPTPPFPEYPSGHSVVSTAASEVLTELLVARPFTDNTHEERGFPPRSFPSFHAAAEEAATSRLVGGIHFPMGVDRGTEQGACVGRAVISRMRSED